MAMHRDQWIAYMTRLQSDWRAFSQEFDQRIERTEHAPLVDALIHDLMTEWARRAHW